MSKLEVKHVDILPNHLTSKLPSNWSSRFQIAGELGAGGFGKVFKVKVTCGPGEHFVSAKYIPRGFWWDERKLRKHLKNEVQEVERLQAKWSGTWCRLWARQSRWRARRHWIQWMLMGNLGHILV